VRKSRQEERRANNQNACWQVGKGTAMSKMKWITIAGSLGLLLIINHISALDFTWTTNGFTNYQAWDNKIDMNFTGCWYNGTYYVLVPRGDFHSSGARTFTNCRMYKGTSWTGLMFDKDCYADTTFKCNRSIDADDDYWLGSLWIDTADGAFYSVVHIEFNYVTDWTSCHFRRIGLARSRDLGANWTFIGDIIKGEDPEEYSQWPANQVIDQGCGDMTLFVDSSFFYCYYLEKTWSDQRSDQSKALDGMYVARSAKKDKMMPGTWYKYHNGAWTEPGLGGNDTRIFNLGCGWTIRYNRYLNAYVAIGYGNWYSDNEVAVGIASCTNLSTQNWDTLSDLKTDGWSGWYYAVSDVSPPADPFTIGKDFRIYCSDYSFCKYLDVTLNGSTTLARDRMQLSPAAFPQKADSKISVRSHSQPVVKNKTTFSGRSIQKQRLCR